MKGLDIIPTPNLLKIRRELGSKPGSKSSRAKKERDKDELLKVRHIPRKSTTAEN